MKNKLAAWVVLMYFASPVLAQTDTIKTVQGAEVVISASRFPEDRLSVPNKIETVNSKEIRLLNTQTSADMLQNSGHAFVQKSQGGGGSPVLRGFEASRVLIVVDGVRMNNAIFRAGHLQNILTVDQSMIDRVEIIYGPGSLIYGSDALGGVMHFFTRQPALSGDKKSVVSANAFVRYASANTEKTGHIDFNIGCKKLASYTSFTFSDFDDLRQGKKRKSSLGDLGLRTFYVERINDEDEMVLNDHPEVQKFSGYHQYDITEKILFSPNESHRHTINLQYSNSSNIPRYDRLTDVASNGDLANSEWYYGPQTRFLGSYRFEKEKSCKLADRFSGIAAYQYIEESRHDRRFESVNLRSRNEKVTVYSLNLDAEKKAGNHRINYGTEATHNIVGSHANRENLETGEVTTTDTRYPSEGCKMSTLGIYLTHQVPLAKWLLLKDGIRWTYTSLFADFSDKSFFPFPYDEARQKHNAFSGNLGFVATPGHGWKISLLVSTGFRAPNVDDLSKVFESGDGTLIVPNPDLKPEYTYNAELGVEKKFGDRVSINATGYYTLFRDAIVTDQFTFNGSETVVYDGDTSLVLANINKGQAYITGVDAGIRIKLARNLHLSSIMHYTYGRIKTDSTDAPLDHIPPFYGRTGLAFTPGKFNLEIWSLYNATKPLSEYYLNGEDNEQYATPDGMPSWATFNFRASYRMNRYLELQAGVENIFDMSYRVFASGINAPGRNFIVCIRGSF